MNVSKLRLMALPFIVLALVACSNTGSYGGNTNSGYGNKEVANDDQTNTAATTVLIQNFTFNPPMLTISAGDAVEFVNEDSAPHTATANNGSFNTDNLTKGQSKTVVFSDPGTFEYFCAIHPNMKGTVVVQ